jgi:hypothetical protein
MNKEVIEKRQQQVLYDVKWKKFLKKTWIFRHLPFVNFVLAAGSMALGNVHEDSDFDVIIAARRGRIFTARLFAVVFFGLLGWRRKKLTHHGAAKDKICLNHFITEAAYRLKPPYNAYWKALYIKLVPLYGEPEKLESFFQSNSDWIGENRHYGDDLRHLYQQPSLFRRWLEHVLGDWFERLVRDFQIKRIERGLKLEAGYEPRIIYNDQELEFHPDTRRMLGYK